MSDPADFQRLLSLLGREGETIRLCRGNATTFAAAPVDFDQLGPALTVLEDGQWNVWYELNPTRYNGPAGRSSAGDITRLTALYADLDFKPSPQGLGSLAAAMDVVSDLSGALGTQPAAIVYSGGGIQPYWPISDGQIIDGSADVERLLKRWGLLVKQFARANNGDADSVFDLPRILRVPGSVNFKDPGNPKPTAVDFFDTAPVTVDEVSQVLDDYEITDVHVDVDMGIVSPMEGWEWADSDCMFAAVVRREIETSVPSSRHHWALKWAAILHGMIRSECVTEATFYQLREALIARFQFLLSTETPPRPYNPREIAGIMKTGQLKAQSWSKHKLGEEMRQHSHDLFSDPEPVVHLNGATLNTATGEVAEQAEDVAPLSNVTSIFSGARIVPDVTAASYGSLALNLDLNSQQRLTMAAFSDVGNAERFGQWVAGKYIHVAGMGWLEHDGSRYRVDAENRVQEAAKDMLVQGLGAAPDDASRKWLHGSLSAGKIKSMIAFTTSLPHLSVSALELDSRPYELNTPSGVLDFTTGTVRPSDPMRDFHTKQTAVPAAEMPIPRFMEFLRWTMDETVEQSINPMSRTAYLQRLFGAAIIGKLLHHIFPIFLGSGSNGKSTLAEIWGGVLGDYALVLPPKFLIQKSGNEHPTNLAQLQGARLVIANETPPNASFDEDLVKTLSGDSRLRARFLNKDNITIENTWTAILTANHLPAVKVGGTGFWRRVRKVDFTNHMPINRQDVNLVGRIIAEEGPGILWWGMLGAQQVMQGGMRDPQQVLAATRDYQLEEDAIARFIEAHLEEREGIEVSREAVYEVYRRWTFAQGGVPLVYVKFVREILQIKPTAALGDKTVFTHLSMLPQGYEWAAEEA